MIEAYSCSVALCVAEKSGWCCCVVSVYCLSRALYPPLLQGHLHLIINTISDRHNEQTIRTLILFWESLAILDTFMYQARIQIFFQWREWVDPLHVFFFLGAGMKSYKGLPVIWRSVRKLGLFQQELNRVVSGSTIVFVGEIGLMSLNFVRF